MNDAGEARTSRLARFPALRAWSLSSDQTTVLVLILIATFLVYLRCLSNGFVFDDFAEIADNRHIAEWSFFWKSFTRDSWWFRAPVIPRWWSHAARGLPESVYYRPLQNSWLALNFHLFGAEPTGWHLAKIFLHLSATALVFRAAQLLTGSAAIGFLSMLFFGLAPVHVDSTVWATAIPEPLATNFELGSLICFLQRRSWRGGLPWALVLAGCALLSHESAFLFPLIIGLYVFLLEDQSAEPPTPGRAGWAPIAGRAWTALRESAPFLGVAALYLAARIGVLGTRLAFGFHRTDFHTELTSAHRVVLRVASANHSIGQLLTTAPAVVLNYIEVLAFPWLAGPAHPVEFVTSLTSSHFYLPLASLAVIAAIGCALVMISSYGRLISFAALWILVGLAPAMNLDQIVSLVQDRYAYFPSVGWSLIVAVVLIDFANSGRTREFVASGAAAALALSSAAFTWRGQPTYQDDTHYFLECVARAPNSSTYHAYLAGVLERRGDIDGAVKEMEIVERLEPDSMGVHDSLARLYRLDSRGEDSRRETRIANKLFAPWANVEPPVRRTPPSRGPSPPRSGRDSH